MSCTRQPNDSCQVTYLTTGEIPGSASASACTRVIMCHQEEIATPMIREEKVLRPIDKSKKWIIYPIR